MKGWERLSHTADIKIRVFAASRNELFEKALRAMFEVLEPVYVTGQAVVTREIEVNAPDAESLLVNFLSEALYLSAVHGEAYTACSVSTVSSHHVHAEIKGLPIERFEHGEIKAVTYHELVIEEHDGKWQVDIVFDV